jgi:glycogen operon protein
MSEGESLAAARARSIVTGAGSPLPLGARCDAQGIGFAVYAPDVTTLALALYERADDHEPFALIELDARRHRTGDYWHAYVEAVSAGVWYAWRTDDRELLDPCAREVSVARWNRARSSAGEPGGSMRGRAVVEADYDWEGDAPLTLPSAQAIIYEMHVRGFTRHASAGVRHPGTYRAIIEKIPYLKSLGVTHVELLPVMAFDEQDVPAGTAALGLHNYWGYSPSAFFAPHAGYAASGDHARTELRDLVKALHRAGLGVILDVVLNHTAEGGADGPTLHFKALARGSAYLLDAQGGFSNYSGCGNTLSCNYPALSRMLLECAEYWVREMHVDGLRFDLASVLTRGEDGVARADAWLPGALAQSPVLARTWLIAEPWDAGGLYQVGSFPRRRFAEWNGHYRDVIRRFVRGDPGLIGAVAQCLTGSSDLYRQSGRTSAHSINFVTCHDGFTLADLVSYERKHNEGNGEANRDGSDANWSSNCGIEGDTSNPLILRLRARQARNLMAILLLSQGIPMILAGDELLRTQRGNNNAYCQDNELSWLDWNLVARNADMLRFVRAMTALRKRHPSLTSASRSDREATRADPAIAWHGAGLDEPLWRDPEARVLAFTLAPLSADEAVLHVVFNMSARALHAPLPAHAGRRWHLAVDTWRASPDEIIEPQEQPLVPAASVLVHAFTVVVLEGRT